MTDMERFIEMYKGFGIEVEVEPDGEYLTIMLEITLDQPKLVGYPSCYTAVYFTKEGEFVKQGFWE